MRTPIRTVALLSTLTLVPAAVAHAKGGGGGDGGTHGRCVPQRGGKFTWGMSHEDCVKVIADGIHDKYVALLKKEQDVYKQDQLRKNEMEDVQKVRDSFIKFDGISAGSKEWG